LFEALDSQSLLESIADKIKSFNRGLKLDNRLPKGISVLNPFQDNAEVFGWSDAFYDRFYSDSQKRHLILGINPGRLGAGQTGIPFTDTKRLFECFGLGSESNLTHESSSAFVYRMIDAFGGAADFYSRFLVSSVCPLGFVMDKKGKQVNFNYYDSPALQKAVSPFIVRCMEEQLSWPIERDRVFCLGTGKNLKFLQDLNNKYRWFGSIVPLEHPRFIMQYKAPRVDEYIDKYVQALQGV
jgi:hypothetical protein